MRKIALLRKFCLQDEDSQKQLLPPGKKETGLSHTEKGIQTEASVAIFPKPTSILPSFLIKMIM